MAKRLLFSLLALAFILSSAALLAHDLWTTADNPEAGKPLAAVVGYGHAFPAPEPIDEIEVGLFTTKVVGPKGDVAVAPGTPNYIWNSTAPVDAGTYLVVANVDPAFWSNSPEGWSMKPKNETPGATSCSRSAISAKGVVTVGSGGASADLTKPQGLPLEIVPSSDPAKAKVGEALSLTVLLNGKPLPAAVVNGRYAGFEKLAGASASAFSAPADKDGKVSFVPLAAGDWLLSVRNEQPFPDLAVCDKDSNVGTFYFSVK